MVNIDPSFLAFLAGDHGRSWCFVGFTVATFRLSPEDGIIFNWTSRIVRPSSCEIKESGALLSKIYGLSRLLIHRLLIYFSQSASYYFLDQLFLFSKIDKYSLNCSKILIILFIADRTNY